MIERIPHKNTFMLLSARKGLGVKPEGCGAEDGYLDPYLGSDPDPVNRKIISGAEFFLLLFGPGFDPVFLYPDPQLWVKPCGGVDTDTVWNWIRYETGYGMELDGMELDTVWYWIRYGTGRYGTGWNWNV